MTPDSFSDGGRYGRTDTAVERALEMAEEGADIIDIGGESTRPGADPVSEAEEIDRVVPVIEKISAEVSVPISIDTTKSNVARAAIEAGARIVNDVSAMRFDPHMASVVHGSGAGLVLMHMQGEPRTMQLEPTYDHVVTDVIRELMRWALAAEEFGIKREAIAIDPGIGFGKTREHNLVLLKSLSLFGEGGYPVLVGPSRKSFIGTTLDVGVDERVEGTAAVVAWCVAGGANIVRVHDVKEMVRVVRMTEAIREA